MALKSRILTIIVAVGLGLGLGWTLAAQQAPPAEPKKMKTNEEFEAYQKYLNAKTSKEKITALDAWKKGWPETNFLDEREQMYLAEYQAAHMCRETIDKALEFLQKKPNDVVAINAFLPCAFQLPTPPGPTAADFGNDERIARHVREHLDEIFTPSNAPAGMTSDQWAQAIPGAKPVIDKLAQQLLAWIWVQPNNKDNPKAEVEITKFLKMDGTMAAQSDLLARAMYGQATPTDTSKVPFALWHFARASAYTGPNALTDQARASELSYTTKAYNAFHCSDKASDAHLNQVKAATFPQGLDPLLTAAKGATFPPEGFKILSCSEVQAIKDAETAAIQAADPQGTFWRELIKDQLMMNGDMYFKDVLEGAGLPGPPGKEKGIEKFKAKLVSMTPATKPKQLVLALEKPDVADVTLEFDEALPGTMEPGAVLQFTGVAKAWQKDPFMMTFTVVDPKTDLEGWTGTNPKQTKAAPKAATKGGATKGKATPGKAK